MIDERATAQPKVSYHFSKVSTMKNFFQSNQCTEFYNPTTNELWVFGDKPENITELTPHIFVSRTTEWGDGSEKKIELPVTDGHGQRENQEGLIFVSSPDDLLGTTAETAIRRFWIFNN